MYQRVLLVGARLVDGLDYLVTLARLTILDHLAGPRSETPTDQAIREQRERLRAAFPRVEFDDPKRHVR